MKFYQSGRSMVEMLGVLAIIGVLSVGAISGYSKAMFKYRLNNYAHDLSEMLFNIYDLYKGKSELSIANIGLVVPYSFVQDSYKDAVFTNGRSFVDVFGNYWGVSGGDLYTRIGYNGTSGEGNAYNRSDNTIKNTCPIIFQTAKEMQVNKLSLFHTRGGFRICNDGSCTFTYSDLTVSKIDELCTIILNAENGNAILYFYF